MSTQRYISTSFWDDKWIRSLDPSERYLYMYLLTNTLTTISGIYRITIDRIAYDTGYDERTLTPMIERFKKAKKADHFEGEYMILPSWPKHQRWEVKETIKKGIDKDIATLPERVKIYAASIGYQYPIYTLPVKTELLHTDIDTDIDTDRKYEAPSAKKEGPSRLETLRKYWNESGAGPECRLLSISFRPDDSSDCLRTMSVYTDEEIEQAITIYAGLVKDPEYDTPRYGGFVGFMRGGVEKFVASANPAEAFKIRKKFESAGEREERERAEALAKLEAMP